MAEIQKQCKSADMEGQLWNMGGAGEQQRPKGCSKGWNTCYAHEKGQCLPPSTMNKRLEIAPEHHCVSLPKNSNS